MAVPLSEKDRAEISAMAGHGLTHDQIAAVKGISRSTLERNCKTELAVGKAKAAANVAQKAYAMAISGKYPAMTMFWLKCQCRWREVQEHELTGAAGGMGAVVILPGKSKTSDEWENQQQVQ